MPCWQPWAASTGCSRWSRWRRCWAWAAPVLAQPDVRRLGDRLPRVRAPHEHRLAARVAAGRARPDQPGRHREGGALPRSEIRRRVPGVQGPGAAVALIDGVLNRAFYLEQFRDYLSLEAGTS